MLDKLVEEIRYHVSTITDNFEVILVEDASPDKSWEKIEAVCSKYSWVKGLKLSRNFGQHHAISAGLDHARGEWVVVMDCDLQDRPEEIVNLYNAAIGGGYDFVLAGRFQRNDSFLKKLSSKVFHGVLSYLSGTKYDASVGNFGIYNSKVIDAIMQLRESIRYFPSMRKWVGFKHTTIEVRHDARDEGTSSYTLGKLIGLAVDIILSHAEKPMRIMVNLGVFVASVSFVCAIIYFLLALLGKFDVIGFASLIISLWFFSGLIIFFMGILGLYVGKIFNEVKQRPLYIVDRRLNSQ